VAAIHDRSATTAQPPVLPGFERLQRYWDPENKRWTAKVLPGEYYVTRSGEAITTVLGSCISACIRDPMLGVGGMNHFMLPEDGPGGGSTWLDPAIGLATRYGSYAMESLVNDLLKLGAARNRLEVKLFGGGKILTSMTDVGLRNIEFIHGYAQMEGYPIAAEDLGGTQPRVFPGGGPRQGAPPAPDREPQHRGPREVLPRHPWQAAGRRRRRAVRLNIHAIVA
jgi:chemotaxis protein CheD